MLIKANKANTSLEDLAAANSVEVVSALSVNQKSATLVGAGNEPYVVGAAFAMGANETSSLITGNKGVYMLQVTAKNIVDDLEDYTSFATSLAQLEREKVARLVIDALESSATITDLCFHPRSNLAGTATESEQVLLTSSVDGSCVVAAV